MQEAKDLRPRRGEKTPGWVGRVEQILDKAASNGVNYPSVVRADMMLESVGFSLGTKERTNLLALTGNKDTFPEMKDALISAFPNEPPASRGYASANLAEEINFGG